MTGAQPAGLPSVLFFCLRASGAARMGGFPTSLLLSMTMLVVFVLFPSGNAIRCYECNSKVDEECKDGEINKKYLRDCTERIQGSKYTLCRKIRQWVDFQVNDMEPDERVIRTCGWEDRKYVNECYYRAGLGGRQEVCTCIDNECNIASPLQSSILAVLVLSLLALWRMMA